MSRLNVAPLILLVLFLTIFFLLFFGKIFSNPNGYLFCSDFDGLKNYFTTAYYVHHDSGFHFSGMNHPYGSHVFFGDTQPLLAWVIKSIGVKDYVIGIMNALIFLSFYVCAFFLYKILRLALLPTWYALVSSFIITILSPQLFRITGHYGLAYAAFIPVIWYLIIRYYNSNSYKYLVSLFLIILVFGLLHPYYLLVGLLLGSSISIVSYLQKRKKVKEVLPLIVSCVLSVMFFKLMMIYTDPVSDHAESTYGPVTYRASFESIFFPVTSPALDFWKLFIPLKAAKFEGFSFVGSMGLFLFLFLLFKIYRYVRRKKFGLIYKPVLPDFLSTSIWAAVWVLIFSMAIPWKWNLEFLLDYVAVLKQFRSIGRFAWIFYYVFTVVLAFYGYLLFRHFKRSHPLMSKAGIALFLLVWVADGLMQAQTVRQSAEAYMSENFFRKNQNQVQNQRNRYQAIVGFPFYLSGTEKVELEGSSAIRKKTMQEAFLMGIPMLNGMIARPSVNEYTKLLQLLTMPGLPNPIVNDLLPRQPLYLIVDKHSLLRKQEHAIISLAEFVKEDDNFQYYEIWPDLLKPMNYCKEDMLDQKISPVYYQHFDERETPNTFLGKGAFESGNEERSRQILDEVLPVGVNQSTYEISYWMYLNPKVPGVPSLNLEFLNDKGEIISATVIHYKTHTFDLSGNWMRIEHQFVPDPQFSRIRVTANEEGIVIDELLIRETTGSVEYQSGVGTVIDNFPCFR